MSYDDYLSNLWEETIRELRGHDKSWDDVCFVGIGDKLMSKEDFKKYAKEINYASGGGLEEITLDLVLYGLNFIVVRDLCEECEEWRFISTPDGDKTASDKYDLFSRWFRDDRRKENES